jgi:hypothetical protein
MRAGHPATIGSQKGKSRQEIVRPQALRCRDAAKINKRVAIVKQHRQPNWPFECYNGRSSHDWSCRHDDPVKVAAGNGVERRRLPLQVKPFDSEPIESWTRQRSHGGPIDYERRRRLDYSTLLTEGSRPKAAADAHSLLAGTPAVPARCYLIGRISESPTVALLTHPDSIREA